MVWYICIYMCVYIYSVCVYIYIVCVYIYLYIVCVYIHILRIFSICSSDMCKAFVCLLAALHGLQDLSPWPGIEPGPHQWKPWILTTRPPGTLCKAFIVLKKLGFPVPTKYLLDSMMCQHSPPPASEGTAKFLVCVTYLWQAPNYSGVPCV